MKKIFRVSMFVCALLVVSAFTSHTNTDLYPNDKVGTSCKAEVELLSFKVSIEDEMCKVSWVSLREASVHTYILERSLDYNDFETIAKVQGAVDCENVVRYTLQDIPGKAEAVVYRLKVIDGDGNSKPIYAAQLSQEEVRSLAYNK